MSSEHEQGFRPLEDTLKVMAQEAQPDAAQGGEAMQQAPPTGTWHNDGDWLVAPDGQRWWHDAAWKHLNSLTAALREAQEQLKAADEVAINAGNHAIAETIRANAAEARAERLEQALNTIAPLMTTMFNMLDYTPGTVGTELRGLYERAVQFYRAALTEQPVGDQP